MRTLFIGLMALVVVAPLATRADDWNRLASAAEAVRRIDDAAAEESLRALGSSPIAEVATAANHMLARVLARRGDGAAARSAFAASQAVRDVWRAAADYAEIDVLEAEGNHAAALQKLRAFRKASSDFRPMEAALRESRLAEKVLPPKEVMTDALETAAVSQVRLPGDELIDRAARAARQFSEDQAKQLDRRLAMSFPESELADLAVARLGGLDSFDRGERLERVKRLFERRAYERCRAEGHALWDLGFHRDTVGYYLGKIGSERLRDDVEGAVLYLGVASAPAAPFAAEALSSLALALGKQNRGPAALKTWELWFARYGDGPPSDDWRKRFHEDIVQVPATLDDLVEAQYDRARLLHQLGRSAEAARTLDAFLTAHKTGFDSGKYRWFVGFWRFRAGDFGKAIASMRGLAGSGNPLVGGKARYWIARAKEAQGKRDEAVEGYLALVTAMPLTYYAALAERRLESLGAADRLPEPFDPTKARAHRTRFQDLPASPELNRLRLAVNLGEPDTARAVLAQVKPALQRQLGADTLDALELSLAESLESYAARRSDARRRFIKELKTPPSPDTIAAWRAVYPRAYATHVQAAAKLADFPEWLVYAHMLQESRFKPWMISGAPAFGLLELLDRTARRLATERGDDYQRWMLLEPRWNVRWGTQYLGALAKKFDGRLPLASASYNGGPRLVVALLGRAGDVPFDVFVDDMSTHETRNYVRRVIEHAIRYAAAWSSPKEQKAFRDKLFPKVWRGDVGEYPDY